MSDAALVKLDAARAALAECKTAMESKQIADIAEAARVYLERTNASVETVNRATEVRLLAERQMGAFLKDMPKNTGTAGQLVGPAKIGTKRSEAPTLKEIGITHADSSRAQKLAAIPEPEFHERMAVAKASGGKLSTAKVLEPAKRRPPAKFDFGAWKKQAETVLKMWMRSVPAENAPDAITYLHRLLDEFSPNE